jgi:hypothetical protein
VTLGFIFSILLLLLLLLSLSNSMCVYVCAPLIFVSYKYTVQVTCFPLLGSGDFVDNARPFDAPHSQSVFIPDYLINPHPRFAALARNIRERRGGKVDIKVPLFKDVRTPEYLLYAPRPEGMAGSAELSALRLVKPSFLEPDTNINMDAMVRTHILTDGDFLCALVVVT